jgi:hypothetical protein
MTIEGTNSITLDLVPLLGCASDHLDDAFYV